MRGKGDGRRLLDTSRARGLLEHDRIIYESSAPRRLVEAGGAMISSVQTAGRAGRASEGLLGADARWS